MYNLKNGILLLAIAGNEATSPYVKPPGVVPGMAGVVNPDAGRGNDILARNAHSPIFYPKLGS